MDDCKQCANHSGQDQRITALEKEIILRFSDLERRLGGLNELRNEVTKDRDQFLRSETYGNKTEFYDRWITSVEKRLTVIGTRSITWTAAIAIFFLVTQIVIYWVKG